MKLAKEKNVEITLPVDFVTSSKFGEDGEIATAEMAGGVPDGMMGLDCGVRMPKTPSLTRTLYPCTSHAARARPFAPTARLHAVYAADGRCRVDGGWCCAQPKSIELNAAVIKASKTIIWNGPMVLTAPSLLSLRFALTLRTRRSRASDARVRACASVAHSGCAKSRFAEVGGARGSVVSQGVFEMASFEAGTKSMMDTIVEVTKTGTVTVIGGGDTATCCKKYDTEDKVTHVSTGGGASLELLEGKELPGITALSDK
jgi:hypothetical protein